MSLVGVIAASLQACLRLLEALANPWLWELNKVIRETGLLSIVRVLDEVSLQKPLLSSGNFNRFISQLSILVRRAEILR